MPSGGRNPTSNCSPRQWSCTGLSVRTARTKTEYKRFVDSLKASVLTAFYTPKEITDTIADVRDILSLERAENGKFVKADIFERPVSFSVESHANVGSPEEALSASLNKFGTVDLDYMREITDSTAEDLLTALQGRIYYNPLVTGYEIKDRFIAGNVIEKAERIEAWMGEKPRK